jgi:hypothetical protein
MQLTDLSPRWSSLEKGGPVTGLTFDCPHCRTERLAIVFHHRGHEAIDDEYIRAHPGEEGVFIWTLESAEDFSSLTITPSIDASACGHWHGFITNGRVE